MSERIPLTQITGRLTRDPIQKSTSKGDVVEFGIASSDGFGDDAKTTFYEVSVWNEGLQASVLSSLQKGTSVTVNGTVKPAGQYNPKVNAIQVATNTWLDRSKRSDATDF